MGSDLTGSGKIYLKSEEIIDQALINDLFKISKNDKVRQNSILTVSPNHIKSVFDKKLIAAKVDFLYETYATDLLVDEKGYSAGALVGNRSGRQAIKAKVIVDASHYAWFAKLAKLNFSQLNNQSVDFKRLIMGGKARPEAKKLDWKVKVLSGSKKNNKVKSSFMAVYEYGATYTLNEESFAELINLDHQLRLKSYQEDQEFSSELMIGLPQKKLSTEQVSSVEKFHRDSFFSKSQPYIFVAGPAANLDQALAKSLMRPHTKVRLAEFISKEVLASLANRADLDAVKLDNISQESEKLGEIKELLNGPRGNLKSTSEFIQTDGGNLAVLGEFDTVVVGGGTGGAPAGIAAAREGAKVLMVEANHSLGGVGTMGLIAKYWYGNRVGFTKEVDDAVNRDSRSWDVHKKSHWLF